MCEWKISVPLKANKRYDGGGNEGETAAASQVRRPCSAGEIPLQEEAPTAQTEKKRLQHRKPRGGSSGCRCQTCGGEKGEERGGSSSCAGG